MNKKILLTSFLVISFLHSNVINSNLVEFNNKFYIPNDHRPYTGKVIEFFSDNKSIYFE